MKFSQKVGGVLLFVTGLYLSVAAARHFGYAPHSNGFLAFEMALPGAGTHPATAWRPFFLVLFGLNWIYFWSKLQAFIVSEEPMMVAGSSCLFFVFLLASSWHSLKNTPPFAGPLGFVFLTLARNLMAAVATFSFVPVVAGNGLLLAASFLGLERIDPIAAQLEKKVRWPRRVRHGKYLKKALRTGATYLGFEAAGKRPVFLSASERNMHVQVVGTTGSGKTLFTLFPMMRQDIRQGRGVVFIDAKGSSENAHMVERMVREAGRERDFVSFSLTQIEGSSTYNPLQHGNPSQLKDKIAASIDWSEPFYQRVCESALQTLFTDLEKAGRRVTLPDLWQILQNPPPQLQKFSQIAEKNAKEIRTLFSEIELLVNTPFAALLAQEKAAIDLLDVYRTGKIVYFGLDTQSYQHTAMRIGKIITQDLNTLSGIVESSFRASEKKSLAVYIDEFQAFGTRGFVNALARGRSSGLWITIAHQSMGDLKAVDEAFAQQVFENTNTKVILRVNDPETAQLFADSVGTAKTIATTSQVHLNGEEPSNIMGSQHVAHEYLVHPGEFKSLDPGQAIFKSGRRHGRISLCGYFPKADEDETGPVLVPKERSQKATSPSAATQETHEEFQV